MILFSSLFKEVKYGGVEQSVLNNFWISNIRFSVIRHWPLIPAGRLLLTQTMILWIFWFEELSIVNVIVLALSLLVEKPEGSFTEIFLVFGLQLEFKFTSNFYMREWPWVCIHSLSLVESSNVILLLASHWSKALTRPRCRPLIGLDLSGLELCWKVA